MTLALTHSSWINAWTLRRACAAIGVDLRVSPGQCELPLPQLNEGEQPEWLFFTEEASLRRALAGELTGRFMPERFPASLLDDKQAFADFLAEDPAGPQALAHWPLRNRQQARYPLLLKGRHSWVSDRKLPRGWVCRNSDELDSRLAFLDIEGLREDWFFLQEWLGDEPLHLLSVGGFFDAADEARNLAVVTRRIADYGEAGPSSSAILITVPDERGLVEIAEHVLRRLHYRGPYEFEFIVTGGRALALELNPRFWMQHGLFVPAGNGLVKRYLGMETEAERAAPAPSRLLWVDGTWLLRRMLQLDLSSMGLVFKWAVRGYRTVVCPSLGAVLRSGLWRVLGRRRV